MTYAEAVAATDRAYRHYRSLCQTSEDPSHPLWHMGESRRNAAWAKYQEAGRRTIALEATLGRSPWIPVVDGRLQSGKEPDGRGEPGGA